MLTHFRPRIRSRHPSHKVLRHQENNLPMMPFRSRIRLGSTTPLKRPDKFPIVELNAVEAIKNSSNKLLMKNCFTDVEVKTADWWTYEPDNGFFSGDEYISDPADLPFPIISKGIYGSRGRGNTKHDNVESLKQFLEVNNTKKFIFEKYYNYNREYRLHVDREGCFYTCRKMLKSDAPKEVRWYRNDDHCVWILEENEAFDKPVNWEEIVNESIKALNSVGLDFGAVDLRVQSAKNKDGSINTDPSFIVVEINSAPSFGEKTAEIYLAELPRILTNKYNNK